jgi:hypothetical protein
MVKKLSEILVQSIGLYRITDVEWRTNGEESSQWRFVLG